MTAGTYLHDSKDFGSLIQIAAERENLSRGIVEKDYWVTHTLWAMQNQGFEIWFKGGTSLSKGFGLIQRFSEDLDLKLEHADLPGPTRWRSDSPMAIADRRAWFEALTQSLAIPGATTSLQAQKDDVWRSGSIEVSYAGGYVQELVDEMKPFVLLEVGNARVAPWVERALTSYVHQVVEKSGQTASFRDNRPSAVHCVSPVVTLLDKLDAISRRAERGDLPQTYIRHYEDAAAIARSSLATLDGLDVAALARDMHSGQDIRRIPSVDDSAFRPGNTVAWNAKRRA